MRIACRELPAWFSEAATIVLPSAFLAGVAREQFAREQLECGRESWQRPLIFGVEAWLVSIWHEARYALGDVPSLLSPAQERALWHETIEQEHPQLFDVSATVGLARSAANVLAEWQIPAEEEAWNDHVDAQQFQHWHRSFRRKCRDNRWCTRADLARMVAGWFSAGELRPHTTAFVGFEHTSPALERVFASMGALGVRLPFDHPKPAKKATAKSFDSVTAELDFAARRLRHLFEEDTKRSLALFVPELTEQSALVERTLDAVFFPSSAGKLTGTSTVARESLYRVMAAERLIDQPLVSSALLLLNLALPRIDHADAGAILRSPFIHGAREEQNERALADNDLRKRRELDVSFRDIERASRACPILTACWQKLAKLFPKTAQPRPLAEWSELISELLMALGWPGDRELTPKEERTIESWTKQLSELSSLGLVSQPVAFESAIGQLRRLLSIRLDRGEWLSPIQVLDARQADGVEFDYAIAVGLSEETWPPPMRVSPLVPLKLQRNHKVPGSTQQDVRDERTRQTQVLFESASEVTVTFCERLSSLATAFVAKKGRELPVWDGQLPIESFVPEPLEQQPDSQAPPFVASGVFRAVRPSSKLNPNAPSKPSQSSACTHEEQTTPRLASMLLDRGSFVHKALEIVWRQLKSLQNLLRLPPAELKDLVRQSISEAVKTSDNGPLHILSVETERERLQEVILEWLDVERARQQDFTVETIEHEQKFEVPGLSLNLRVDRIDRLSNGNLVLIDYKSGKQSRPKLSGVRPPEPQLLVYAASVDSAVDGVFFGQLKPRDIKAVGYSRTKQFKGQTAEVKKDWDTYIETSCSNVEKLALEFVSGTADVHPTGGPCEFCGMKPFCRVNEKGAAQEEEE